LNGRHTGRSDIPLTAYGRDQAKHLAKRLKDWRFGMVMTSPLKRAEETCRLAGFSAGARVDDDLAEWDYGEYDGQTSAQIHASNPDWDLWRDGGPGGETPKEVGQRADQVISKVLAVDGSVLLVSHGHLLRVLAARWIQSPPGEGRRLAMSPAAISILGYEHQNRVISVWNDTGAPEPRDR
jgi:probable phosphoglycerate mutase